jgi:DNA gyrase subunit A
MSDQDTLLPFERPVPVDIEEEMKRSYLDYAMSVIVGRALPDVRDGLKPVHRRVLYGMWEAGNRSDRPYKKSARIVGEVMGKYHPHGDMAIYDTVVRLAQPFSMRAVLVDGQGNFGSIDGDNPAAMRYTEVRLAKLAEAMFEGEIDKETVDWAPNYDGQELEPSVLPARVPNLLVNGSAGIAVGMATNIPPHNLGEVVDALVLLVDERETPLERLMRVLPGPDFPTAGFIHGLAGIRQAYETGRGIIQMRARVAVETQRRGEKQSIIVSEIPYQVNKKRLLEAIGELVREKRMEGISDLRDESDRDGIRIVIEVKRGEVPEIVLNQLYKLTQLQTSFGIILLAIVDGQPRVCTLRDLLLRFLDHRKTVVIRRTRFDLRKAEERAHVLEGLLKALDHLDEVIATIRASQTPPEAREQLVAKFAFTAVQADAILDLRLQRLTGLERQKILDEYRELLQAIDRLRAILGSERLLLDVIRGELLELKEKFAEPRRTEIIPETHEIRIEDMIADEEMVITVSSSGYVKRSPLSLYRAQGRGGKGRTGMTTKEGDFVERLFVASAHSYLLVFTAGGRVHWIKVHEIPQAGPAAKGKALVNLLQLAAEERLAATVAVRDFPEDRFLVFATEQGTVKKTALAEYRHPRAGGIIAIHVEPGDRLFDVKITDGTKDLFLATADGMSIRFAEADCRAMGRVATGVRGITLRAGDRVVGLEVLEKEGALLTAAERGLGKRTDIAEYRVQGRGGIGLINLKVTERTGRVVGVCQVLPGDQVMLMTQEGMTIRTAVDEIREIGRSTQGVKLIELSAEDRLVAMAKLAEREEENGGDGGAPGGGEPGQLAVN